MNKPIYLGNFANCYDGEMEIYQRLPSKRNGVLSQISYSKTLKGAMQKAQSLAMGMSFIIHTLDTGKYLIYV